MSKIYMWKEVTGEALPVFQDINNAPEQWIWEVVKKNIDVYDEITSTDIETKAKELFGEQFAIEFPNKGNSSFELQENVYQATNIELDTDNDCFFIKTIKKTKQGYELEVIEYLEDYSEEPEDMQFVNEENQESGQDVEFAIHIKNLNGEEITTVKNIEGQGKIIEKVKEEIEKFNKKKIELVKGNGEKEIYIKSVSDL